MKVVPIRFFKEEYEKLRLQAFEEKRSMAEIVREALNHKWKGKGQNDNSSNIYNLKEDKINE